MSKQKIYVKQIEDAGTMANKDGDGFSKITVSDTEPSSPSIGDLWVDTSD